MQRTFRIDALINTSVLPSNIMSLRDKEFLDFVKKEAGDAAAALFLIQGINCVKSLLMTDNVHSIMDMKSKSLNDLKKNYGLILDDNTCIVQSGVKGNIDYLIDLLKRKSIEDTNLFKRSKHNQTSSSNKTIDESLYALQLALTTASNTLSQVTSSKCFNLSINAHKNYIIDTINILCQKNKSEFNLSNFSFVEGTHYFISIETDSNNAFDDHIKCSCNKRITLQMRRERFQMSNFYRHLLEFRSGYLCLTMEEIIYNLRRTPSEPVNSERQPVAPLRNVSQQTLSVTPNNEQQPVAPPERLPQQTSSSLFSSEQQPVASQERFSQQIPLLTSNNEQQPIAPSENVSQRTPFETFNSQEQLFTPLPTLCNTQQSVLLTENISQQGLSKADKKQVKRKIHTVKSSYNIRESSKRTRR